MIDEERPLRQRRLMREPVADAGPRARPQRTEMSGRFARLEPLDPARHHADLWPLASDRAAESTWDYLPYGPWTSEQQYRDWLRNHAASTDPLFYAVRDLATDRALGIASFLRIEPATQSIEIGHLWFSRPLQRTPQATEAIYLLLEHALTDLRYRRMEWKCNALNAPSRRAARRFGFTFEGIFYQHLIVKGCNRDTAWYSILDGEWPAIRAAYQAWLAPENFDADGRQRRALGDLMPAT